MAYVWVFCYGSLMWNNAEYFPLIVKPAVLMGAHRSYNLKSIRNRGTPDKPGLVLGLADGGQTMGKAMFIDEQFMEQLDSREGVQLGVYEKVQTPTSKLHVLIEGKKMPCVAYVTNTDYDLYVGHLSVEERAMIAVRADPGLRGTSVEYIENTHFTSLQEGIHDPHLKEMYEAVFKAKKLCEP